MINRTSVFYIVCDTLSRLVSHLLISVIPPTNKHGEILHYSRTSHKALNPIPNENRLIFYVVNIGLISLGGLEYICS